MHVRARGRGSADEEWKAHAACQGTPDYLWHYPDVEDRRRVQVGRKRRRRDIPSKPKAEAEARFICARCPVAGNCLEYALRFEAGVVTAGNRHGIYGGLTAAERADGELVESMLRALPRI